MIPEKLQKGDQIRIIAPSESLSEKLTPALIKRGIERLESLGLKVSFGKYIGESNNFDTTTVEHRLEDFHDAFRNSSVKAILALIGGSSANQLLPEIDYELIRRNPKIFCGLSDLTEISSAIYTQTGLVTYYGPHFTMLAGSKYMEPSLGSMKEIFFSDEPVILKPSEYFLNKLWDEELILNTSFWAINEGEAEGSCIGGNLMTMDFLLGSRYFPDIKDCIIFIEENHLIDFKGVQKELQEILNHPQVQSIKGLLIGRFQKETGMSRELVTEMIKSKKVLKEIPVVANVDISHTAPIFSIPFGGKISMKVGKEDQVEILVTEH